MIARTAAKTFRALADLGAGEFAHLNGSLERHLRSVHDLLTEWRADEVLCRAGLFHAAYGTAAFDAAMVDRSARARIVEVIGAEAEQIAYRYCSCDRSIVWPQIGRRAPVLFRDRFTGESLAIGGDELAAFCELTCANEVEIATSDRGFVEHEGAYLGTLFATWHPFLSDAARRSAMATFGVDGTR